MIENYVPHRFDPRIAEIYGIESALIYSYLGYRSRQQPRPWVEVTLTALCKQYPYMGRYQVWSALHRLTHPGKKTPVLVFRKQVANAYFYRPATEIHADDPQHTFNAVLAERVGIEAAIVFHNISYFIKDNWKKKAEIAYKLLDPEKFDYDDRAMQALAYKQTRAGAAYWMTIPDWIKRRPYITYRTARRSLAILQREGLLRSRRIMRHKTMWFLPQDVLQEFEFEMVSRSDLENQASKSKRQASKIKQQASKSKRQASNSKQESTLSDAGSTSTERLKRQVEEAGRASHSLEKKVLRDSDGFASSLADARSVARSASLAFASLSEIAAIRKLNQPNFPQFKKKMKLDCFGNPVKRKYTKAPDPEDEE